MILPLLLCSSLWLATTGFYLERVANSGMFKHPRSFKPSEFQALNIKLDYGTSQEPQRLSRREKIALKLTQITKTTTD
jgi:hypothetical protein